MSEEHLLLVDSSGFAHRAYYAWNPVYRHSDGKPIGAILGFMGMMWRMRETAENDKPTHAVAVFDPPGKNFRHKLYPAYKANRDPNRSVELEDQLPAMRSAAAVLGFLPVELNGYEADDVIATLAIRAMKAGIRVTIVSSDKDFGQLVVDGKIEIVDPMKRVRILEADVRKKFGVDPALVPHVQALAGDSVDGIPGIDGIGLQRGAALIRRFGSVEGALKNRNEVSTPSIRNNMKTQGDSARLWLKLTTLRRNAPVRVPFEEMRVHDVKESHVRAVLKALEAEEKFGILFTNQKNLFVYAPHIEKPLEWWENELIGANLDRAPAEPQCGYFKRRLVVGGEWVGARIWRDPEIDLETSKPTGRDVIRCEVNGRPSDPVREWDRLYRYPVKKSEFAFEIADADHAKRYRPDHPKANPSKPIQFASLPAPHCPPSSKPVKKIINRRKK